MKLALVVIVTSIAAAGCSRVNLGQRSSSFGNQENPVAPGDTIPNPAPPPEPPVIQPALFLSYVDTTAAGGTASTRWLLGNDSDAPFTMHWTLNSGEGWPGLPLEGTADLAAYSTQAVTIPVVVPATASPGMHGLTILVTRPGGLEYTSEGVVRVHP